MKTARGVLIDQVSECDKKIEISKKDIEGVKKQLREAEERLRNVQKLKAEFELAVQKLNTTE